MGKDLADLQAEAIARGYTYNFGRNVESLAEIADCDLQIVESVMIDSGTDPGDDVTIYLIEARGQNGYLMVSDSFHTDPARAAFVDALLARG